MKLAVLASLALALCGVDAHQTTQESQHPFDISAAPLEQMWGELWPFQGINTFAHLHHETCLTKADLAYDVGLIGVPFDTATSYRSGARFGPRAIRAASQRQTSFRGYNPRASFNPYTSWAEVIDCGDIPVTPMDNSLAFKQMDMAFEELLLRRRSAQNAQNPPRYILLGGDHSVILPHLRSLKKLYGPVNVIHFDAHLDTWKPDKYPSFWSTPQSEVNHGSMLWKAYTEGLLTKRNVHAGIRTKLSGEGDLQDDDEQHWLRISADDIWINGVQSVIDTILDRVPANTPTYISVDVDVLDPGFGSGTGTQEPGGWLPRELLYVLRGIDSLTIVGGDIVEVNPDFDHAEITSTNGAQVAYELLTSMVKKGPLDLPLNAIVESEKKDKAAEVPETHGQKAPEEPKAPQEQKDTLEMQEKLLALQKKLEEVEGLKEALRSEIAQVKRMKLVA